MIADNGVSIVCIWNTVRRARNTGRSHSLLGFASLERFSSIVEMVYQRAITPRRCTETDGNALVNLVNSGDSSRSEIIRKNTAELTALIHSIATTTTTTAYTTTKNQCRAEISRTAIALKTACAALE